MVSLAVSVAALYTSAVSSHVRPGFPRVAMLLPVGVLFMAVPLAFSSAVLRCSAFLFLTWLGAFKVLLLAMDRGPLNPSLPVLHFLLAVALPVELITASDGSRRPDKDKPLLAAASIISCTFKVVTVAAMAHFYWFFDRLHLYVRLALYGVRFWFSIEVLFACAAAGCSAALDVEVKPQFVQPYLATSLRDFWGRRWNLPVSAVLRAAVYNPLRARAGKEAGLLATFLVSGLMHEALLCYSTLQRPTGKMAAFFLLHGACRVAEDWCARRWPPPPRPLATLLFVAFMTTSFCLVFAPLCCDGWEEMLHSYRSPNSRN
jgi:hypothetical protein